MNLDCAQRHFEDNGYVFLPSILAADEAGRLAELIERRYRDPATHAAADADHIRGGVSLMRMFEYDASFRDLLALEPVITLIERILGPDCHAIAQNGLRTSPGKGIVTWHIDDALFFPFLADGRALQREIITAPCFSLNFMILLTDAVAIEFGPTEVVAGSHRTGARPDRSETLPPGTSPTSLLAAAGDGYLVNSQTWHRGAQNTSGRTRYLLTTAYGRRFISQRFYPFLNYRMPDTVLDGADHRLLRLLGRHEMGPYG